MSATAFPPARPIRLSDADHAAIEREGQPWYEDRQAETALRGYRLAQEVVNRHKGRVALLEQYIRSLEGFVLQHTDRVPWPPHLILTRCMAMNEPLPEGTTCPPPSNESVAAGSAAPPSPSGAPPARTG